MSEFKYACPVCGQHIRCDSTQSGTTMECPTCFQKIVAPQAPATTDTKFIITGTKAGRTSHPGGGGKRGGVARARGWKKALRGRPWSSSRCSVSRRLGCLRFTGKFSNPAGQPAKQGTAASNADANVSARRRPNRSAGWRRSSSPKATASYWEPGRSRLKSKDPAQAAFLAAFKADLAHPMAFEGPVQLTPLSGSGRTVPGATGEIHYLRLFSGGLVIGVTLAGLVPNHEYILTLNGAVEHAGNNNLPDEVPSNHSQKYYDFSEMTTDANGRYQATFGILLPAGPYDVYFFVKDTTDWKIVLSHNFFKFTVE